MKEDNIFIMNSGREIDILNISADDICVEDIAHHLTKWCRYTGALPLNRHYSVANHSLALFYYALDNGLDYHIQRACLMHDAAEAYIGDINGAIKPHLPDYKEMEYRIEQIIKEKYGLVYDSVIENKVKELDTRILLDEAKVFFPNSYHVFKRELPGIHPLGVKLYNEIDLSLTKTLFLHTCEMLDIRD